MEIISVNQFSNQFSFGNSVKGGWPNNPYITQSNETETVDQQPLSFERDIKSQQDTRQIEILSHRLQNELRAAKSVHLSCTEVLLPSDLLPRIASQILTMSEQEPCGIRGCTIFIEFEGLEGPTRRISSLKCDSNTVSTFELFLTLKQDKNSWTSMLPQFLKNLARGGTVMISHDFVLSKNKLYRSYQHQE